MPDSLPVRRRSRLWVAVLMVVTLAAFPIGTLAVDTFADVPDSNPFHGDINAIAAAGVTSGCGGGLYCPSANVTREQMAAFMNRLGALSSDKTPVVNATTVDRYDANALNRVAYTSSAALVASAGGSGSLTATITAPGRGYLLISGTAELYNQSPSVDSYAYCDLQVDNTQVPNTDHWVDVASSSAGDEQECNSLGGYLVCGGTYSVEFFVDPSSNVVVDDASMMVEYVPFNGSGGIPTLIQCAIIIFPGADTSRNAKEGA